MSRTSYLLGSRYTHHGTSLLFSLSEFVVSQTHVCVHQSALDLLGIGVTVHVVCDAVGSQRPMDMDVALQQMARDGVRLTTSEAIAFRLLGTADDLNFKNVSALLKARHAQR